MSHWRVAAFLLALAAPARAGEAMLGAQGALLEAAPAFVSAELASRRSGPRRARAQESTFVAGAGAALSDAQPFALTLAVPLSHVAGPGDSTFGPNDAAIGVRYRLELGPLAGVLGRDASYLLVMAAAELPTGSIEHPAFEGGVDGLLGLAASLAWRELSGGVVAFYRTDDLLAAGLRAGYRLWDDRLTGGLLEIEAGISSEHRGDGSILLAHPTVRWNPGGRMTLFAGSALPLAQEHEAGSAPESWRAAAGLLLEGA